VMSGRNCHHSFVAEILGNEEDVEFIELRQILQHVLLHRKFLPES
jgi:hypothetical protein